MNYIEFYYQISKRYQNLRGQRIFEKSNQVITYAFYVLYPILLIYMLITKHPKLLVTIIVPAISVVLVSLIRKWIGRPRPFEIYPIHALLTKDSKRDAMPSRHIFSATIIAMMFFHVSGILACMLLVVALLEGYIRVVGGVHYPSDVIVGYLLGVLFGLFTL